MAKRDLYTAPRNVSPRGGEDDVPSAQDTLKGIEKWYEHNSKTINYLLIGVVALIGAWFAYNNFIKKPKYAEANEKMFRAEQYFGIDSFNLALNGDGNYKGFLYIIDKYGSTPSGNLAQYYAGVSYLKLGQFQKAIDHLSKFDANGSVLGTLAQGSLGDAYMELNQSDKALSAYKTASSDLENLYLAPVYRERLGLAYEKIGKTKEAIETFKQLRIDFPMTQQGMNADRYLARLGDFTF